MEHIQISCKCLGQWAIMKYHIVPALRKAQKKAQQLKPPSGVKQAAGEDTAFQRTSQMWDPSEIDSSYLNSPLESAPQRGGLTSHCDLA